MVFKIIIFVNDYYRSGENYDYENCLGENLRFGFSCFYGYIVFFEFIWISFVFFVDIWFYLGVYVIIFFIKC